MMNAIQRHSDSLRLTTFLLVLVLSAASSERDDNIDYSGDGSSSPVFSASCDWSGLYVTVTFSHPFKGTIFASRHESDPSCRMPVELATSEISMTVPLTSCGSRVKYSPGDGVFVINTIAAKYQDEIYVYDYETVICRLGDRINSRWLDYPPVGQTSGSNFTRPFVSRIFAKRMGEESTERSIKQREARNGFLKATIKTLARKLMKNKRQPRVDLKESGFEKRFSLSEDSSSIGPTIVQSETTLALNETSTVEVTSMFPNIQVHVINISNYDSIDNYDSTEDTDKFNSAELEHSLSEFANFSTIENLLHAANTVVSVEKPTGKSLGRRSMEDLTTASNGTSDNADNFDKTVVSTVSTVFEALGEDLGKCVPRMRFTVITISLVFVGVALFLVCCGMALYMRKEKKKRSIDNFLLYNFL